MKTIDIFDSLFENSISMAGYKRDFKPKQFEWNKEPSAPRSPLFFTESHLDRVGYFSEDFDCYLILIEPEALHPENYQRALELEGHFEAIFTHDGRYVSYGDGPRRPGWHFYTFGGSWIINPEVTHKLLDVSMIASHKKSLPGHKLRHKIARYYINRTQNMFIPYVWGSGYTPFDSKQRILADYRFMIVVENVRQDYWFTEKLLDALSMGCIPIYWGCPSIGEFFNTKGILQFETYEELQHILRDTNYKEQYKLRIDAVRENAELAKKYFICEDLMADAYPDIFQINQGD